MDPEIRVLMGGMLGGSEFGVGGLIISAVVGGTISEMTGGKFKNGAASAAFSYAMSWAASKYQPGGVVVTGHGEVDPKAVTPVKPEFFDKDGNSYGHFNTLEEALQAGENVSREAAEASGTGNEYGVATIKIEGKSGYFNSSATTSNNPMGIAWDFNGFKANGCTPIALNHLHPGNDLGFSNLDKKASRGLMRKYPEFQGIYMFDGKGNHWYGPKSDGNWLTATRTHSCGGASATTWSCPAMTSGWTR